MKQISDELYEKLNVLGLIPNDVNASNVGESNYAKHLLQPWAIWRDWNLNPWDADIVKRVLRTKKGESRKMDYEKIIHICKERIRQIESEEQQKKDFIVEGVAYMCVESIIQDCGDHLKIYFNEGDVYKSPKDKYLIDKDGFETVIPQDFFKNFKRI